MNLFYLNKIKITWCHSRCYSEDYVMAKHFTWRVLPLEVSTLYYFLSCDWSDTWENKEDRFLFGLVWFSSLVWFGLVWDISLHGAGCTSLRLKQIETSWRGECVLMIALVTQEAQREQHEGKINMVYTFQSHGPTFPIPSIRPLFPPSLNGSFNCEGINGLSRSKLFWSSPLNDWIH